jgi:hypothetical protein
MLSIKSDLCRLVFVIMVLFISMYRVTFIKFHQVCKISFVQLFVPRTILIKFDLLRSLGLPSIKFDILLDKIKCERSN